jgi:putative membrane protein
MIIINTLRITNLKIKNFFINMAKGAAVGIGMIIPGVSGGTIAVILKIYDKLIEAIGNLFKDFKQSLAVIAPVLIGAVLAFAAAYFPLTYALTNAPLPTVLLFAGLMLGGCPKLVKDASRNGFKKLDAVAIILPLALVVGLCFIPGLGNANLNNVSVGGYFLLVAIGAVASCALVIPGISGSMLLMILGYYAPLLAGMANIVSQPQLVWVYLAFILGVVIGFFTIAKLMQWLLNKFPRTTYWAIVGFVIGSIPAIIITFGNEYGFTHPTVTIVQIVIGILLFVLGTVSSYLLFRLAKKMQK